MPPLMLDGSSRRPYPKRTRPSRETRRIPTCKGKHGRLSRVAPGIAPVTVPTEPAQDRATPAAVESENITDQMARVPTSIP